MGARRRRREQRGRGVTEGLGERFGDCDDGDVESVFFFFVSFFLLCVAFGKRVLYCLFVSAMKKYFLHTYS